MSQEHQEDLDYEQDVVKLKQVWEEIKQPSNKKQQKVLENTTVNTQNKFHKKPQKQKPKEKKTKVIISEENLKNTQRNVKPNPKEVISIVTRPEKFYSDNLKNQKNTVAPNPLLLTNPQKSNLTEVESLKKGLSEKDYQLSLLRVSNSHAEDKIRRLENQIQRKEDLIEEMKNRERQLIKQVSSLTSKDFNFNYGKVEYENFKNDSRRLLKMLKNTQEYQKFAEFALDDDGTRFLTNANKSIKTKLDTPVNQSHFHFCTCNKAFIPEQFLWIPEKAYNFGKQFIKGRSGDLSQTQFELLLYELNKIWRQREKRIVNNVNALKSNEVGRYKRKMQSMEKEKQKSKQVSKEIRERE